MIVAIIGIIGFIACQLSTRSTDYFYYEIRRNRQSNERYIRILNLTTYGKSQKILVIPDEIGGVRVAELGHGTFFGMGTSIRWSSQNLEKVFFMSGELRVYNSIFRDSTLREVIVINGHPRGSAGGRQVFVSTHIYEMHNFAGIRRANVTYYFNFETDFNYGIHWIDNINYGEVIYFIPPNPMREGYTFVGWYMEPETINRWNFETDRLPTELMDENDNIVFQETRLYARWERN